MAEVNYYDVLGVAKVSKHSHHWGFDSDGEYHFL